MWLNNFLKLVIAIVVSELAGVIGSVFTVSAIPTHSASSGQAWYAGLVKPALNPPSWIFGPVWTTLYALMGVSLFLLWKQHTNKLENVRMLRIWKIGIAAFFIQLFLNALWSILFFGLKSPGWALVDITALWFAIVWAIAVFYKISKPAAYLLVPYLLWVGFAGYLNYSIVALNQAVETRAVDVYYYSEELDRDAAGNIACSRNGLVPVKREIPITQTPIQNTIQLLLLGGLTDEEQARGIGTEYPLEGFSLKEASLKDGILTLEFNDSKNKAVGGACRVGILWFQIEATVKQFREVQEVRFLPEDIFQP